MNPLYAQNNGESDYDYGLRLIGIKIEQNPQDLDWSAIVEALGLNCHPDSLRKAAATTEFSGYKVMQYFKKKYAFASKEAENYLGELELKEIDLKKERQKYSDERTALNKLIRERAWQEELNDILEKAVQRANLPVLTYTGNNISKSNRDILVSMNDLHYGAVVDNYWNKYNPEICADMLSQYIDRILTVASGNEAENCYIWCNGDAISGSIHHSLAVTNKENVIKQTMGVSELLSQFVAKLSPYFNTVYFLSVAGNHSRLDAKDRALPDERLDDIPEWYLKARLQSFENVTWDAYEKIDPTMYLITIRGKTYLGVHGDLELNTSKVQSLSSMAQRPVYSVLSGHKHHNCIDNVQGIKTVMAGSFLGVDSYAVGLRIIGQPEQLVSVVDDNGFVCHYDIQFNK